MALSLDPIKGQGPVRMCRVCRRRAPKAELKRWVIKNTQLVEDLAAVEPGRGYYTDSPDCEAKLPLVAKRGK